VLHLPRLLPARRAAARKLRDHVPPTDLAYSTGSHAHIHAEQYCARGAFMPQALGPPPGAVLQGAALRAAGMRPVRKDEAL
jgi:hypothetical protein